MAIFHHGQVRREITPPNCGPVLFPQGPDNPLYKQSGSMYFAGISSMSKMPHEASRVMARIFCSWDPNRPGYVPDDENSFKEYVGSLLFSDIDLYVYKKAYDNAYFSAYGSAKAAPIVSGIFSQVIIGNTPAITVLESQKSLIMDTLAELNFIK